MEPNSFVHTIPEEMASRRPPVQKSSAPDTCSVCHQPVRPEYYFCPNCGNKLRAEPLSTSVMAQVELYAFSILLPIICFIMVTKWKGIAYFKSSDPKAKQMGMIAWALILLSTLLVIYLSYLWTIHYIQETLNDLNTDTSYN